LCGTVPTGSHAAIWLGSCIMSSTVITDPSNGERQSTRPMGRPSWNTGWCSGSASMDSYWNRYPRMTSNASLCATNAYADKPPLSGVACVNAWRFPCGPRQQPVSKLDRYRPGYRGRPSARYRLCPLRGPDEALIASARVLRLEVRLRHPDSVGPGRCRDPWSP